MDKNPQPQFITWENDIRKYIGKRIAEMRKQAGISQVELAEKSGVGDSHIARIEMGRYSVGIDTLQKIADVFGKKIEFVELPKINTIFEHTSGVKGVFVKRYTPTGHVENIMIDCGECKFHAPASEFKEIVSQKHCNSNNNEK